MSNRTVYLNIYESTVRKLLDMSSIRFNVLNIFYSYYTTQLIAKY